MHNAFHLDPVFLHGSTFHIYFSLAVDQLQDRACMLYLSLFRHTAFAAVAQQHMTETSILDICPYLIVRAIYILNNRNLLLFIQLDAQIQHQLHGKTSFFPVQIRSDFCLTACDRIADIGDHHFPAVLTVDCSGKWERCLIILMIAVLHTFIQKENRQFAADRDLFLQRTHIDRCDPDALPDHMIEVRHTCRQLQILSDPVNIPLTDCQRSNIHLFFMEFDPFRIRQVNRRFLIIKLIRLKCQCDHASGTDLAGIDHTDGKILNLPCHINRIVLLYALQIHIFFKAQLSCCSGQPFLFVLGQIQHCHQKLSFHQHMIICHNRIGQIQCSFPKYDFIQIRIILWQIHIIFQRHLTDSPAFYHIHMNVIMYDIHKKTSRRIHHFVYCMSANGRLELFCYCNYLTHPIRLLMSST